MNVRQLQLLLLALVLLPCTSCASSDGIQKVIVAGSVTYAGTPVKNGEIRFHPIEGTIGPVSGGPIVDGNYRAVAKGGVPVGKHTVKIIGYRATGSSNDDMLSADKTGSDRKNYLPDKYNDASELTIKVSGVSSSMTQDFELAK